MDLIAVGTHGYLITETEESGIDAGSILYEAETGDPFLVLTDAIITRTEGNNEH
jgi:hypothetical protein